MTTLTCVVAGWVRLLLVMLMVRGKTCFLRLVEKELGAKERTPEELIEKRFFLFPLMIE
jgi:hypothetical protein